MSTELEIQQLVESATKSVHALRESQDSAIAEQKKHGQILADTQEKQAKIEADIGALIGAIDEVKKAQLAQAEAKQNGGLSAHEIEAKNALFKTLRKQSLSDSEQKALSTLTNPDGGYLTSADMTGRIIARLQDFSPMRRYANVKTTSKSRVTGIINNGRNAYSWGAQAASVTNSDTKQFGEYQIDVKKLLAYPKATEEMLEDGDYDIEALIMDDATMGFAEGEAYGFLLGNGVLQPRGLMTVPTAYTGDNTRAWGTVQKFKTGVNGAFAATPNGGDIFIEAAMSLRSAYRTGAVWAMNRFTLATAMKLKDSEGNYIWQPTWNLQDAPFGTICGIPVAPDFDHLADVATNSLSIVVGNLNQAYQIVDKRGISVIRDNITSPGNVNWYISKRTGGDLVNSEAVRFIEFKA